jgi:hypothetical protein
VDHAGGGGRIASFVRLAAAGARVVSVVAGTMWVLASPVGAASTSTKPPVLQFPWQQNTWPRRIRSQAAP